MGLPKVSILMPTLNSEKVLLECLKSIRSQNYPKNLIEIIIADGGSTDKTLEIAQKFATHIVFNRRKTGEAGKKVGLNIAKGEFSALIDSDNILPSRNWLKEMVNPLVKHPEAVGSEPWAYTWRTEDGFIDRYCALMGINDPLVYFLGNYDRLNTLTKKWTEVPHLEQDCGKYVLAKFEGLELPTIGANGTVFRTSFLKKYSKGPYLFDVDILAECVKKEGGVTFVKTKNGIIHTYCGSNIKKFAKKQNRRIRDFLYHKHQNNRSYTWVRKCFITKNILGQLKFMFSCLLIFPLVYQAIAGYMKKPDKAWLFHILACEITLWEYGKGYILSLFSKNEATRENWKQ